MFIDEITKEKALSLDLSILGKNLANYAMRLTLC